MASSLRRLGLTAARRPSGGTTVAGDGGPRTLEPTAAATTAARPPTTASDASRRRPTGRGPTPAGLARRRLGAWRADVRAALLPWLANHVLVAVGALLALVAAERLVTDRPVPLEQGLLAWDGAAYRQIAAEGYDAMPLGQLRFFPLFPLLGRALALGGDRFVGVGLVVVANVAAFVALVLAHRIARMELGDRVAELVPWVIAVYPAAFVLVLGYSEALLLVCSLACFLGLRQERWWLAAIAGFLAGTCRPLGVVLALPAFIEVVRTLRHGTGRVGWRDLVPRLATVIAPVVGLMSYLLYARAVSGDWWAPIRTQETLRGDLVEPVTRLARAAGDLFSSESLGDGLHAPFAVGLVVLVVLALRSLPLSYGAYSAVLVLLSISAENLNSLERYGLNAFPLLMVVALLAHRWKLTSAVLTVSSGLLVALTALAYLGAYVP